MARIRTIKPEFFTSEDIVSLSPLARLLYIALWCEADREGRLVWKPRTFKLRYFPADTCDIDALCAELLSASLVSLYGDGFAVIPAFRVHQHINPRETQSQLPEPDASMTRAPRVQDASPRDSDVQGGREGKGKEGKDSDASRHGSRLPADWQPTETEQRWARDERPDIDVSVEVERFRDYWIAQPGVKGRKSDWPATWRNWVRRADAPRAGQRRPAEPAPMPRLRA